MQYATLIDGYAAIMRQGNNGGYANSWLVGDRKKGKIAYLELGLHHTPLTRKTDGYFVSSNFAADPDLIRDDTPASTPQTNPPAWTPAIFAQKTSCKPTKASSTPLWPRPSSPTTLTP